MGNQQGAMPRERHKSGSQDLIPGSPIRGKWKNFHIQIRKNRTKKFLSLHLCSSNIS